MAAAAAATSAPPLILPPPYSLVTLRESGDAHAHACRIAGEAGAGTLVWARRFDLIEFAVVLEPEEPLRSARRAFYCGMNALADAISVHGPPEREVTFAWPDTVLFNGARVGGGRLGWPNGCREDEVPGWLVFSAMLTAAWVGAGDPGLRPDATSLEEEGFETADGPALIEAFARYLMLAFDTLGGQGFDPIASNYLGRLAIRKAGERRGIDVNGDLLIQGHARDEPERLALVPALERAEWLDPATGMPEA
jgi:Biotin/lipoate A/B protein ligase family